MNRNISFVVIVFYFLVTTASIAFSQKLPDNTTLYFLGDCQEPMNVEKLYLRENRNIESRDRLFVDIIEQQPRYVFFVGDLVSVGSSNESWRPVDGLLFSLRKLKTHVNAIAGNHEYYFNAKVGIRKFTQRFPQNPVTGYYVKIDSMAVVMLNSNFRYLSAVDIKKQQTWYASIMDSLDNDEGIKAILVCAHHPPFSNSKVVGSSKPVEQAFVPRYIKSPKAKLFVSGHSHNLEYFKDESNKYFIVIGGGGGLTQPLYPLAERKYLDLLNQDRKPIFFYLVIEKIGNRLFLKTRGLDKDFVKITEFEVGVIN